MPLLKDFSGLIFDLDGLVLDTEPTYFAAWQAAVEALGFKLSPSHYQSLSGYDYNRVKSTLAGWLGAGFDIVEFDRLAAECWRGHVRRQGIQIKPGLVELLDYACQENLPYCIATNSQRHYAEECLALAGLAERFPLLVSGTDVERVKPAPDIFIKAAAMLQVDIADCVVFEDSPTGIIAAAASGAYSVFVPSTFPVDPEISALCDCLVPSLAFVMQTLPEGKFKTL